MIVSLNWLKSYSLYTDVTDHWYNENVNKAWADNRKKAMSLLQQEASLLEIAQLVGKDSLPEKEKFILLVSKMIREDFLQQNAFNENDMYCPIEKQFLMIENIMLYYNLGLETVEAEAIEVSELEEHELIERIARMKYVPNQDFKKELEKLKKDIQKYFTEVRK
jgi:V/A-type H+-transporting ATPase subunit A